MATALKTANPESVVAEGSLEVRLRRTLPSKFELNVEFAIENGITILFGPSGAGKTTLLDCIAGLSTPDEGRISLGKTVLFESEKGTDVPVRCRRIGYVFQDLALFTHLNLEANVAYGLSDIGAE